MNNQQLIFNIAIQQGIYSKEEANHLITKYGELPLHSLQGWKSRSPLGYEYHIKRGEHGIECRLWKKREAPRQVDTQAESNPKRSYFYLAKTFLFDQSQVELLKKQKDGDNLENT